MYDLGVHVIWDLLNDANRDALDQIRVELWERPQHFVGAVESMSVSKHLAEWAKRERWTYLGDSRICERMMVSCATMHTMFKCGPYANKKSHSLNTSGSGGVQAHNVRTDGKA